MAEFKVINIKIIDKRERDLTDMITITRQQFRDALTKCLAVLIESKPDTTMDEDTADLFVQSCELFATGIEYVLFDNDDEEED